MSTTPDTRKLLSTIIPTSDLARARQEAQDAAARVDALTRKLEAFDSRKGRLISECERARKVVEVFGKRKQSLLTIIDSKDTIGIKGNVDMQVIEKSILYRRDCVDTMAGIDLILPLARKQVEAAESALAVFLASDQEQAGEAILKQQEQDNARMLSERGIVPPALEPGPLRLVIPRK